VASPARAAKSLSVGEELLAAAVFGFTMFALRGLYDSVPFLMALGCAGVAAFIVLRLVELIRKPNVSIQNIRLKAGGRLRRSGGVFVTLAGVVVLFLGHSAVIQYHAIRGRQLFERVQLPEELVLSGRVRSTELPAAFRSAAVAAARHFRFCEKWGLTGTYQANLNLAWLSLVLGQPERAISDLRRALEIDPQQAFPRYVLGRVFLATGRPGDAQREFREAIEVEPHRLDSSLQLAKTLALAGRMEEVASVLRDVVAGHDGSVEAHHNLAFALRELGALSEAIEHYSRAVELAPDNPEIHFQLGETYAEMRRHEEAAVHFERAVQIDPRYREMLPESVRP
jgi:tetratricopeptide (TPR) repeat protein